MRIDAMLELKYGITIGDLDKNGYGESIMGKSTDKCYLCDNTNESQLCRHEVVYGIADRQKSKALGLWVRLCGKGCCCNGHGLAHSDPEMIKGFHELAQYYFDKEYGEGKFFEVFGKNYL